jgi:hypothetical protein
MVQCVASFIARTHGGNPPVDDVADLAGLFCDGGAVDADRTGDASSDPAVPKLGLLVGHRGDGRTMSSTSREESH